MRNKKLKDIHRHQDMLIQQMDKLPADSEEYKKLHDEYRKFLEEENEIRKSGRWFDRILQILGIGVSIGGTFLMPMWLANKAAADDAEMKLVNHRILNLIGKRFTKD